MIMVTDRFPPVTIIIPSAALARYCTFEMSVEALQVPDGSTILRGISASLASSVNQAIATTNTPLYWFIDDDHKFEPNLLLRLIAHDVPVVVPLTCFARSPFQPVLVRETVEVGGWAFHTDLDAKLAEIGGLFASGHTIQAQQQVMNLIARGPATRPRQRFRHYTWDELDGASGLLKLPPGGRCGRAGMLVKREVFDAIPAPWFELGQTNPEEPGEDYWFVQKVLAAGFNVYADVEQPYGHIAPCTATPCRDGNGRWGVRLEWENGMSILVPRWPLERAVEGALVADPLLTAGGPTHRCTDGWVCAQHPDQAWPHDLDDGATCAGPAAACKVPECAAWEAKPEGRGGRE
jgi:hypothetical protein